MIFQTWVFGCHCVGNKEWALYFKENIDTFFLANDKSECLGENQNTVKLEFTTICLTAPRYFLYMLCDDINELFCIV